jgi:hypothetical protein
MGRNAVRLELSASEVAQLKGWQSAHGTAQQVALRCRLVLAAADGKQDLEIAAAFSVSRHTASLWRRRVHEKGIGAVWEIEKGRGRKPQLDQGRRAAIIAATRAQLCSKHSTPNKTAPFPIIISKCPSICRK